LKQKAADLKTLSKEQQADIAYLQQALAECRPAWWNQSKAGKKLSFRPMLWGKTLAVTFDPGITGNVQIQSSSVQTTLFVKWAVAEMDSHDRAEHGFTKGDLTDLGIWGSLETANVWSGMSAGNILRQTAAEKARLQVYQEFRGTLAGGYYGTPRARRWDIFLGLDAYAANHATQPNFIPRRPLGAMVVAEIAAHPERYPSLHLAAAGDATEAALTTGLMSQFERTTLTLPEDKALRAAIKEFATANGMGAYNSGKVTLPNKQTIALDPAKDGDLQEKRNTWLKDQRVQLPAAR